MSAAPHIVRPCGLVGLYQTSFTAVRWRPTCPANQRPPISRNDELPGRGCHTTVNSTCIRRKMLPPAVRE